MPAGTDDDLELDPVDGDEPPADDPVDGDEPPADGAPADGEPKDGDKSDKRVRDLQSKADAAEARANKAEKALAALNKGTAAGSNDPAQAALLQELREASLDAVFGDHPELKKYGIDRSLVDGTTRAEMRESAASLVGLIRAVETKAKNAVLAEHGIKAEPAGSTRQTPQNYETMKDEEFLKLLDSI